MMQQRFFCFLLLLLLGGCISYGRNFATVPVKNIKLNVTTKGTIFGSFGEPVRKGLDNGYETWTYSYHYYEMGRLDASKELYIVFNKDDTVRHYSFTSK
ncbi:MAG: hypothetical protein ACE5HC_07680 [Candidatus Binatia bacterium]